MSAPVPIVQKTDQERLAERGAELGRLRTENTSLRKRIAELEQQIDTLTAPAPVSAPVPQPEPAPQWQGKKRRG